MKRKKRHQKFITLLAAVHRNLDLIKKGEIIYKPKYKVK